jgi:aliphatic nitrilase
MVSETELGRVGMLICGENTNPLARYALMAQGEQVHISTYPPVWPTRPPNDGGNYDLEQAIRIRAGAHAFEAKVFNIVASACVDETLRRAIEGALGPSPLEILERTPRGVSMVLGPTGSLVGDALSADEGIVYAQIDLADSVEPKQFHDVVGYYNRFDVFRLEVNRTANRPIHFPAEAPPALPPAGGETDPDKQAALQTTGA